MFFDQMFPKNMSVRVLLDLVLNYNSVQQERLNKDVMAKLNRLYKNFKSPSCKNWKQTFYSK